MQDPFWERVIATPLDLGEVLRVKVQWSLELSWIAEGRRALKIS